MSKKSAPPVVEPDFTQLSTNAKLAAYHLAKGGRLETNMRHNRFVVRFAPGTYDPITTKDPWVIVWPPDFLHLFYQGLLRVEPIPDLLKHWEAFEVETALKKMKD